MISDQRPKLNPETQRFLNLTQYYYRFILVRVGQVLEGEAAITEPHIWGQRPTSPGGFFNEVERSPSVILLHANERMAQCGWGHQIKGQNDPSSTHLNHSAQTSNINCDRSSRALRPLLLLLSCLLESLT